MPDKNTPKKYGQAILRGVVDAGSGAGNTLNTIGTATGSLDALKLKGKSSFIPDWMSAPLFGDKPMTDAEVDGMVGKRQDGVAGFVSGAAQFATGFAVAGEALKPIEALSKVPVLARAIAGGLSDMTVFDPYKARLSNMIESGPTWRSTGARAKTQTLTDKERSQWSAGRNGAHISSVKIHADQ